MAVFMAGQRITLLAESFQSQALNTLVLKSKKIRYQEIVTETIC